MTAAAEAVCIAVTCEWQWAKVEEWPDVCPCEHDAETYESTSGLRCQCCLGRRRQS